MPGLGGGRGLGNTPRPRQTLDSIVLLTTVRPRTSRMRP
jgi:hypothetical protein